MILLDYGDKRPIYEQIVDKFRNLILSGILEADSKMPSVRSLAVDLSINPNTIQRAYAELERQGYIYSVKGRGNFVRKTEDLALKKKETALEELSKQIVCCGQIGISREEILECVETFFDKASS